jgi:hypothetical protein
MERVRYSLETGGWRQSSHDAVSKVLEADGSLLVERSDGSVVVIPSPGHFSVADGLRSLPVSPSPYLRCVSLCPHCVSHGAVTRCAPSLCLPHRLSHCVSLTVSITVSPSVSITVSPSPSLSLCLSHCVSLTVSITVSPSPSLALCLSHRLSHTVRL